VLRDPVKALKWTGMIWNELECDTPTRMINAKTAYKEALHGLTLQ
jgi:hypothetical protein